MKGFHIHQRPHVHIHGHAHIHIHGHHIIIGQAIHHAAGLVHTPLACRTMGGNEMR